MTKVGTRLDPLTRRVAGLMSSVTISGGDGATSVFLQLAIRYRLNIVTTVGDALLGKSERRLLCEEERQQRIVWKCSGRRSRVVTSSATSVLSIGSDRLAVALVRWPTAAAMTRGRGYEAKVQVRLTRQLAELHFDGATHDEACDLLKCLQSSSICTPAAHETADLSSAVTLQSL